MLGPDQGNRFDRRGAPVRVQEAAAYTGLSEAYVLGPTCASRPSGFMRELVRDDGSTVGRFDSRIKGKDGKQQRRTTDTDFSYHASRARSRRR